MPNDPYALPSGSFPISGTLTRGWNGEFVEDVSGALAGLRGPGFRDLAARAQSPGGLAELAGMTIGASIDAVGEAIRRHDRKGAIARYLLTMEKSLLPITDRRRVERHGGYFRKLTDIPDRGIAASLRAMENARAA